jgi:hypothetical protein
MASQVYCQLSGPGGSIAVGLSCTEGTVGELVDEVSGLSIGEVYAGQTINGFTGTYNAGTCVIWVRDTQTNQRRYLGCVNITTGGSVWQYLDRPITISQHDVVEAMTQAVA